jgi:hypothetical protein
MSSCRLLLALLVASFPGLGRSQPYVEPPVYDAADPSAPAVTAETVIESDRFWPYQITLTRPFAPPRRAEALAAGSRGTLVHVERRGVARIDFGRDGKYEVPIDHTNLIERADRIRLGQEPKPAPNFVQVVGTRLVDPEPEPIRPVPRERVFEARGFLAVYAAPDDLARLARALAPLHGRRGVWTVLFPLGRIPDPGLAARLRELDWRVPFLRDELADAYAASRLPEGTPVPWLVLQTPDARPVLRGAWSDEVAASLAEAIDRHFPDAPAAARAGKAPAPP